MGLSYVPIIVPYGCTGMQGTFRIFASAVSMHCNATLMPQCRKRLESPLHDGFDDNDDMQAGSGREHGGDTEEEAGGGEAEGGGGGGGGSTARQGERGAGQEEDHGGTGNTDADENT